MFFAGLVMVSLDRLHYPTIREDDPVTSRRQEHPFYLGHLSHSRHHSVEVVAWSLYSEKPLEYPFALLQVDFGSVLTRHRQTQSDVYLRHLSNLLSHSLPSDPVTVLKGQQQRVQIRRAYSQHQLH